jgi:hypothetical protein
MGPLRPLRGILRVRLLGPGLIPSPEPAVPTHRRIGHNPEGGTVKIESTAFTDADYYAFLGGYFERERPGLVARLRRIPDDIDELMPRLEGAEASSADDPAWNARETLAHMATSAAFIGWAIHEISQGKDIGGQMFEFMNLRDPAIVESVQQPPAELAQQLRTTLDRLAAFVETVPYDDFRTSIAFANRELSAEDFTRFSVVHHLEDHTEQMRRALA